MPALIPIVTYTSVELTLENRLSEGAPSASEPNRQALAFTRCETQLGHYTIQEPKPSPTHTKELTPKNTSKIKLIRSTIEEKTN